MDVIIYIILIYLVIYFLVEYWYVVLIILSIGIILIKTFKYYKKTKPQKVKEEKIRQLLKYFNNYIPKINGLDYETYTNSIKDQLIEYNGSNNIRINLNSFTYDEQKSYFPIIFLKIINISADISVDNKILLKLQLQDFSTSQFQWVNTSIQLEFDYMHIDNAKKFFEIIKNIIAIVDMEEKKHGIDTKNLPNLNHNKIQANICVGRKIDNTYYSNSIKKNASQKANKNNNEFESFDKCTSMDSILRINYDDLENPNKPTSVTLNNNHIFTASDFLSIYGYQTINSSKSQFFFFLDKSRTKKSDQGKIIYPAIKVSSKVVDKFPNLNTEEAKKYIATSYKLYNPESYDDLIHYRIGKHIYYKQQSEIIDDYCVIDIETTGLNEKYDQIIEIAAIRVRDNKITDTFTSLIKPSITIPIDSTAINGITNEMVKNAPTIKEILPKFVEFIGKDTVIGHYVSFDLKFIDRYCIRELGKSFTNKSLDTCHLSRKIFSELKNYKLSTLCHELNITQSNHRADIDCISTKELYDKIKERMLKSI